MVVGPFNDTFAEGRRTGARLAVGQDGAMRQDFEAPKTYQGTAGAWSGPGLTCARNSEVFRPPGLSTGRGSLRAAGQRVIVAPWT